MPIDTIKMSGMASSQPLVIVTGQSADQQHEFTVSDNSKRSSNVVDRISQNTNDTAQNFDVNMSRDTSNESVTSTSLISASSQQKSTSPSTAAQTPVQPMEPGVTDTCQFDFTKFRPRSSIPLKLPAAVYGQQCVAAARSCRLDPYALHKGEQEALQDQLCHLHVTVYLNIRNGILRLWTRNPMVSVTREEALGCAKDYRWMNLAHFAFEWLVRNGHINFGCVEIPLGMASPRRGRKKDGPVIAVVGAGMAGLGCARQLEGLFRHYHDAHTCPRVVLLEGRRRIGGRIYSHPLRSLKSNSLRPGLGPKAEMGAHIIVGFDRGNPLDQIVRSQLALQCHLLRDVSTIYDVDGSPVSETQDAMDEGLYNQVLSSSGSYRYKPTIFPTAEGDRELIDSGRDCSADDGLTVKQYEEAKAAGTVEQLRPTKRVRRGVGHKIKDVKATTSIMTGHGIDERSTASAHQLAGRKPSDGIMTSVSLNLDSVAKASKTQTLGAVMDEGFRQYQRMLSLTTKDMRLLNWHLANLEYANAANVDKLSLSGWDQDTGNEFEGEHSQVIGGYQQVPYGLLTLPTKLDVRTNKVVSKVSYGLGSSGKRKAVVHCEDGDSIVADRVVFTGSLGVLKYGSITFEPPLPEWKSDAIKRLGFGLLNKVILVFEKSFWDAERDMFGLLREPVGQNNMIQEGYSTNRGRFYLFWNCIRTTGLPVLIALMAGDAAHQAEYTPDAELITEVTSQLRNIFKHETVPDPLETIVTRWGSDRFTRGSYSYVAPEALPSDYDLIAKPIGNLYFAGEATCRTHPATVHGAYLSGLRAASEVIESIIGPVKVSSPLVPEKGKVPEIDPRSATAAQTAGKRGKESLAPAATDIKKTSAALASIHARSNNSFPATTPHREAYDQAIESAVHATIGIPRLKPVRTGGLNPFLLYQKDHWNKAREQAEKTRTAAMKHPARAPRDEIRIVLGQMWRQASEEERRPYLALAEANRQANAAAWEKWKREAAEWEGKAKEIREKWCKENPYERWEPGTTAIVASYTAVPADVQTSVAGAPTTRALG